MKAVAPLLMMTLLSPGLLTGWVSAASPPARRLHTIVNVEGVILVFGGQGAESVARLGEGGRGPDAAPLFNDLWAYNQTGNTFVEMSPADPPAGRWGHAAVASGGSMYVFYGYGAEGVLSDVFTYSVSENRWQNAPVNGEVQPEPRVNHTAVATPEGRILVCGGQAGGQKRNDLWEYDPGTGTWSARAPLPAGEGREGHSAVLAGRRMVVFGGCAGSSPDNELWVYDLDGNSWQQLTPAQAPGARHLHAAAVGDDRMVVFGGLDANGKELGDVWELDLDGTVWRKGQNLAQPLAATDATSFTVQAKLAAANTERILLFGGQSGGRPVNRTFIYTPGSGFLNAGLNAVSPILLEDR